MTTKTRQLVAKWCLFILASTLVWTPAAFATAEPAQQLASTAQPDDIEVFVREGCPHCARTEAFLATLQQEQPGLHVVIHDVLKEPAALERLKHIAESQGATVRVPTFAIGGQLFFGFSDEAGTGQLIRDSLARSRNRKAKIASASCKAEDTLPCDANQPIAAAKPETFTVDFFGHSLSLDQIGLPLFTLSMGLLDGFNPCSVWVLLLMISLLAPPSGKRRALAQAGQRPGHGDAGDIPAAGSALKRPVGLWRNCFFRRSGQVMLRTIHNDIAPDA